MKNKLVPIHLESELIDALSGRYVPQASNRAFLSRMVMHGKRLFLHDHLAPHLKGNQHIQYTQSQWDWAITHESDVWRYFVDNELLFFYGRDPAFPIFNTQSLFKILFIFG